MNANCLEIKNRADAVDKLLSDQSAALDDVRRMNTALTAQRDEAAAEAATLKAELARAKAAVAAARTAPGPSAVDSFRILSGADIDAEFARIRATTQGRAVEINIDPGVFLTNGIMLGTTYEAPWKVIGSGIDQTIIRSRDVGKTGLRAPNNCVMATLEPAWIKTLEISDLTLDSQWESQSERQTSGVKYACLFAQVTTGIVRRVKCVHWGSNGLNLDLSECFPLRVDTYSDEGTHILIEDCVVEDQHRFQAGYATAIMVQTTQGQNGGDRIPWGTRNSQSALIRRNRASGIYGHGFGCGHSENVLFEDNVCLESKTGVNIDTGRNRNIVFRRNRFLMCNQGIHIGNAGGGEFAGFEIERNYFLITEPFHNAFIAPPKSEFSYGLRLSGSAPNARIDGNRIRSALGKRTFAQGHYGIGWAGSNPGLTVGQSNVFEELDCPQAIDPNFYI